MSEPFELPDELSEFEQRLIGLPPGGCSLNRDEILYQAGFAAAQAHLQDRAAAPERATGSSRGESRFWAFSTAAFATLSACLALMLFWSPVEQQTPIADEGVSELVAESLADKQANSPTDDNFQKPVDELDAPTPKRKWHPARGNQPAVWAADQPPIRLRQRPGDYDWSFARSNSTDSSRSSDTSNRALLNQYLENELPRAQQEKSKNFDWLFKGDKS